MCAKKNSAQDQSEPTHFLGLRGAPDGPGDEPRSTTHWLGELPSTTLAHLRKIAGMSQMKLAAKLGIKQPGVCKMERANDALISNLRSHIEALGGELTLVVTMPDGAMYLAGFDRHREREVPDDE